MSDVQYRDVVADLQDLRERIAAGHEVSPVEYERVLSALRAHRRAGASTAKQARKKEGSSVSKVEKLSQEEMDKLIEDF